MWFRLASHLNVLQPEALKGKTTFSEFLDWCAYFVRQDEERIQFETKLEYYLAQIACEIRRSTVKNPKKRKVKDFLIRFKTADDEKAEERWKRSKSIWLAGVGVKSE